MRAGNRSLRRLLRGASVDGATENALLEQFWRGYPRSRLRWLLRHPDGDVVCSGALLLQELGASAAPLVTECRVLMASSDHFVREMAVDTVLVAAGGEDGGLLMQALRLLGDPHELVRARAWNLAVCAGPSLLRSAMAHLDPTDGEHRQGIGLLLGGGAPLDETEERERAESLVVQLYRLAAAVRVARKDQDPLARATGSEHPVIRSLALYAKERLAGDPRAFGLHDGGNG